MNHFIYYDDDGKIITKGFSNELNIKSNCKNYHYLILDKSLENALDYYVHNSKIVPKPDKPVTNGIWEFNYKTKNWEDKYVPPDLSELKKLTWDRIKTYREQLISSGVEYNNNIYDSDIKSQNNILLSLSLKSPVIWITKDNRQVLLSYEELSELNIIIQTHVQNVYSKSQEVRELIELAEDYETLKQIKLVI